MDLYDEIEEQTGYKLFVIPVVVFTDMALDPVIDRYAGCTNVKVIWGAQNLLADLKAIASQVGVKHPPIANHIRKEVRAVTVGANSDEGSRSGNTRSEAPAAPPVEQLEVSGVGTMIIHHVEQLIIQNVERLTVQQAPDPTPGLRLLARVIALSVAVGDLPAAAVAPHRRDYGLTKAIP